MTTTKSSGLNSEAYGQPVDFALANECIESYIKSDVSAAIPKTESVEFSKETLKAWISNLDKTTEYSSIRVSLGLYTESFLKYYNKDISLTGVLTVFLMPYLNDNPAFQIDESANVSGNPTNPFNLGELRP